MTTELEGFLRPNVGDALPWSSIGQGSVRIQRMAHLRPDPDALAKEAQHPGAMGAPIWQGKCLIRPHPTEAERLSGAWLPCPDPRWTASLLGPQVYLGRDFDDRPLFAADWSHLAEPNDVGLGDARFSDLIRAGRKMASADFEPLAYAKGMVHWHQTARCCERCGTETESAEGGFKRACPNCGHTVFPRSDPAVMMLVTRGDHCLLARQARFPPGMYSALAGFVEPGESLEECVKRETWEEVRLEVQAPQYFASSPWPFPQSLMLGFFAESPSGQFELEQDELEDARWFHRDELLKPEGFFFPPPMSLAHHLILSFATQLVPNSRSPASPSPGTI